MERPPARCQNPALAPGEVEAEPLHPVLDKRQEELCLRAYPLALPWLLAPDRGRAQVWPLAAGRRLALPLCAVPLRLVICTVNYV